MDYPLAPDQTDSVLYEIASKLNKASSSAEWLEAVSSYARSRGAKAGYLMSIPADDGGDSIYSEVVASWIDDEAPHAQAGDRISFSRFWGETNNWHVAPYQAVLIEDVAASTLLDVEMRRYYATIGVGAVVLLPQIVRGRWVNLLSFHWRDAFIFDERDRRIFTASMQLSASVIERLRLTEQERQRAQRAEQISLINVTLSQARDEHEILDAITGYAAECGACSTVLMYLHSDNAGNLAELTYIAEHGNPPIREAVGQRRRLLRVEVDLLMPGGRPANQPICFEDFQTDPRFTESYRKDVLSRGLRSSVVLPLRNAGAWQALIVAYWSEPHPLSEDEVAVYTAIIPTVASVVARHRAYLETEASEKAATTLYQLAESVNAATTYQETLEAVARMMPDCQGVYLNLWQHLDYDRADYIEIAAAASVVEDLGQRIGHRFARSEFPFVIASREERLVVVEDTRIDTRLDEITRSSYESLGTRTYLRVPFRRDGRLMGAVFFKYIQPHIFTEHERRMALGIADLVMAAVERIRLLQEMAQARENADFLFQLAEQVNAATDYQQLLDAAGKLLPDCDGVYLHLWEHLNFDQASYFEVVAGSNVPDDLQYVIGQKLPKASLPIAERIHNNRITVVADTATDPLVDPVSYDSWRRLSTSAFVWLSFLQDNRNMGGLFFNYSQPRTFSDRELQLALGIGDLTQAAIERIQSQQAEAESRQEREELFQASQAINAATTFREILDAVAHIGFDDGDFYLYTFENFDFREATYIETVATGQDRFMNEGARIPMEHLPFLKDHPRPGIWAYEDVPNHPELDPVTKATLLKQGVLSNLRFGLSWHNRILGAFGIDHATARRYSAREKRMMTALGELVSAAAERIRLQRETHAARERAERLAEQAQQLAALEERTRLARELHDSVSQALYGIGLGAQTARRFLDTDPALVRESVEYVLGLAEAGLAEMRALIFELRPESLENEGLAVALAKQGASLQARHGIEVQLELCDEPPLSLAAKESLYRVAREALHNVIKHARASQMTLRMRNIDNQLCLEIIDNGVGFKTDQDFPGHLGLHSMRERIVQLHGTLTIESAATQGTHLKVVIPVQPD